MKHARALMAVAQNSRRGKAGVAQNVWRDESNNMYYAGGVAGWQMLCYYAGESDMQMRRGPGWLAASENDVAGVMWRNGVA